MRFSDTQFPRLLQGRNGGDNKRAELWPFCRLAEEAGSYLQIPMSRFCSREETMLTPRPLPSLLKVGAYVVLQCTIRIKDGYGWYAVRN